MDKKFDKKVFKEVIDSILEKMPKRNYNNFTYSLVESKEIMRLFFSRYFFLTEGSGMSSDKASYVSNRIIKGLKEDVILTLQEVYDIKKYPQMEKYEGEIAYWCPKNIKNTKEALDIFVNHILNIKEVKPNE